MVDIYYPKDLLKPSPSWPDWLKQEFLKAEDNGHVGMELLSETEQVRVWSILLKPWDRLPVHKHVLNYVWVVTHPGKGWSRYHNGEEHEKVYTLGQTVHHSYETGQFMMHDLENIGQTDLGFITVEFLDSPNRALLLTACDELPKHDVNTSTSHS